MVLALLESIFRNSCQKLLPLLLLLQRCWRVCAERPETHYSLGAGGAAPHNIFSRPPILRYRGAVHRAGGAAATHKIGGHLRKRPACTPVSCFQAVPVRQPLRRSFNKQRFRCYTMIPSPQ